MATIKTFSDYTEAKDFAGSVNAMEFNFDVEFSCYEVIYMK